MSQDLASQIAKSLADYSTEVEEKTDKIAEEIAEETVQELKTTSPKRYGKYAKTWKKKKIGKGSFVVHNENYRLPHLLEFGHIKRNGGRVSGIAHIKPAEEKAIENFEKRIKEIGQ